MQFVALRCVAAAVALAALTTASVRCAASPNIVFILADDLGIGDTGVTNQNARAAQGLPSFATPNIDSIALNGVRFNNMYTGAGNCSPSRNVLLTGFHQRHNLFEQANLDADLRPGEQDKTWAQVLQEGGYATGMFGKWHLGGVNTSATAIRTPSAMPSAQGFTTAYGPMQFDFRMAFHWATDGSGGMVKVPTPPEPTWPGPGLPHVFGDALVANHAVDFIRANAATGQPFAAYVPFMAPHIPVDQVPQDHPYANMPDWPQVQRNYAGMMYYLDQHVGQILNAINDPNNDGDPSDSIAENTIVMFGSDNGALIYGTLNGFDTFFFRSNQDYYGYKNMTTEGGIRTPFFVQWKGTIAPGTQNNVVGSWADILPTLAELTGQDVPLGIDGVSFASELTGAGPSERPDSYSWSMVREIGPGNPAGWTIRVGDWKLAKLQPTATIPTVTYRLFNLAVDPGETINRAGQRPDIVAALEAIGIAEGSELETYGPSPDAPSISERYNTYFTQYKNWQPQNGSQDFASAANWAGGTQRDRPTSPEANFWNTGPAPNWLATMVNTTPVVQEVTLQANADVLALGVAGQLAEMQLNVPAGRILSARNGIRISDGGVIHVTGGELNTIREVEVRPGGRLDAHGTINGQQQVIANIPEFAGQHLFEPRVVNEGEVNVGAAADVAGVLQIKGEYEQAGSGVLHFDLFGSGGVAGVDFDRLAVEDNAVLGGLLDIAIGPGGWTPQLGDRFDILTAAGGITGTFSALSTPVLTSGLGWNFIYTPTAVSLQVIQQAITDLTIVLGQPLGAAVNVNPAQTLNVAGTLRVGDGASPGSLTINAGGQADVAVQTRIEPAGVLTLAGGVLKTPKLDNTQGGTFHWQSGTLHLTQSLAITAAGDLGGTLAVGAGRTLDVDGSINVSNGAVVIDSGGVVTVDDDTVIGAGGAVQLQGGMLTTGALTAFTGGSLAWSTGTLQVGSELTIAAGRALADVALGADQTLRSFGLRIGSDAETGALSVNAGSLVQIAGTTRVEALGILTIDGGDFSTDVLQLDGGRYEAENLAGVGAVVFSTGEMALGANLTLTAAGPLGTTPVIGANQKLSVDGPLRLGGVGNGVMLTIGSGGQVVVAGDTTVGAASALAIDGGRLETAGLVGEAGAMFGWQSGTLRFTGDLEIAPAADLGNAVEIAGGQNLEVAGALHVTSGTLTAGDAGTIAVDGAAVGPAGVLAIDGGKVSLADLTIAAGGTVDWQAGELAFTGDAAVDAQGGVAQALGGQAEIGPGRHLNIHGTAALNAPLRIAGGTFSAGQISGLANLVFDAGTLNLPHANLFVDVGGAFGSSLILTPESHLNIGGTTFVGSQSMIMVNDDADFSSSVLENQGTITLGGAAARLSSSNQIVNAGRITGAGSVFGAVSNQGDGQILAESGRRLHFLGNVDNSAALLATGAAGNPAELAFSGLVTNHSGGRLTATRAIVRFDGGFDNRGRLVFTGGDSACFGNVENTGQIEFVDGATATFHGNLTHNGTLRVGVHEGVPSTAVFLSEITGSGDAAGGGNVIFEGRVSPGNSVGTMAFQTNVEFGAASTLSMELGGRASIDSDQFLVDGRASLSGSLVVDLINDFVPAAGETFTLMLSTQGITGTFDQVVLPEVPGIGWQLNYSLLNVVLRAVEGPPVMQADFDGDGDVDGNDFLAWQRGLGKTNAQLSDGDGNGDGVVDGADLAAWRTAFGSQGAAAAVGAVPEPATAGLALAAIGALAAARSRRVVR